MNNKKFKNKNKNKTISKKFIRKQKEINKLSGKQSFPTSMNRGFWQKHYCPNELRNDAENLFHCSADPAAVTRTVFQFFWWRVRPIGQRIFSPPRSLLPPRGAGWPQSRPRATGRRGSVETPPAADASNDCAAPRRQPWSTQTNRCEDGAIASDKRKRSRLDSTPNIDGHRHVGNPHFDAAGSAPAVARLTRLPL